MCENFSIFAKMKKEKWITQQSKVKKTQVCQFQCECNLRREKTFTRNKQEGVDIHGALVLNQVPFFQFCFGFAITRLFVLLFGVITVCKKGNNSKVIIPNLHPQTPVKKMLVIFATILCKKNLQPHLQVLQLGDPQILQ